MIKEIYDDTYSIDAPRRVVAYPEGTTFFPRVWCMPNRYTFVMPPVKELLDAEMEDKLSWCDPFAGHYSPADFTNDIDPETPTLHHEDALVFLKRWGNNIFAGALFDPPYSPEQARRCYKAKYEGIAGLMEYLAKCRDEIARIIRPGGKVISFGWNSAGIGSIRGFKLLRGLLLNHGTRHDTIVTVEEKQ